MKTFFNYCEALCGGHKFKAWRLQFKAENAYQNAYNNNT